MRGMRMGLMVLAWMVAGARAKSHPIPNPSDNKDHHGSRSAWDDFHNKKPVLKVEYHGVEVRAPEEDDCYLWPDPHSERINDVNFWDSDTEIKVQPAADIMSEFGLDWDDDKVLAFCELSCFALNACEAVKAELPSTLKATTAKPIFWKCCRRVGWKLGSIIGGSIIFVLIIIGAIVCCCCCGCCICCF